MKKTSLVLLGSVVLFACCVPAFAGSEISLLGSSGSPIKFTGTGSGGTGGFGTHNFTVSFNIVNLVAFGVGSLASGPGFYSIVNSGSTVYGNSSCGAGCFMLGQTGPLAFSYGSTAGAHDLLTGNLTLVDLTQTAMGGGIFNDSLAINFTATGGILQPAFANNNGVVTLQIKFTTTQDLATILNHQNLLAKVVSGAVFPVPEPTSLSFLSSSLVGLAFLCRKRKLFT